MPFKIVNTIEKGQSVLTTVPSAWEKEGSLFWPRLAPAKVDKLRRLENSKPGEDWKIVNCILKRRHLSTFNNAESEIERMCTNSETETDNEKEKKAEKMKTQPSLTFENIVQDCINITVSEEPQIVNIQPCVNEEHQPVFSGEEPQEFHDIQINDGLQLIDETIIKKIDNLVTKVNIIQENQNIIQGNINIIIENQKTFYESQQLMMLNLAQTVTQLEEYMNKSSRSGKKTEDVDFQIIQNDENLRTFEHLLENPEKELEIKKKLASICGKGKGRGINNAYALIDALFDREFLNKCSWAGGSRTTERKVCFKSFTKVIKLFFDLVHDSDNSFTLNECHNFFKNVLKNSSQRCNSKKLRTSTTKHRPKKKSNVNTNNTSAQVLAEAENSNN